MAARWLFVALHLFALGADGVRGRSLRSVLDLVRTPDATVTFRQPSPSFERVGFGDLLRRIGGAPPAGG